MVSPQDITARAHIRECALRLFAEKGPDAVSVRDIAACAGVSPALVLHHYGSKAGLREAVNAHVVTMFDELLARAAEDPAAFAGGEPHMVRGFAELFAAHLPAGSPIASYLRRLLLSGDPAGRDLFAQWFRLSHDAMRLMDEAGYAMPTDDADARAAFVLVNDLALILLHEHIGDVLGVDPLTASGMERWANTAFDAYLNGVFRKETS